MVMRTLGIPAYYLVGGYQAWKAGMQNVAAEGDPVQRAKKQTVACWFEGDYIEQAGLAVKPAKSGGYVPPREPVNKTQEEDSLGLGLGIGLGLGLGLGPEDAQKSKPPSGGGKLKIGEGC